MYNDIFKIRRAHIQINTPSGKPSGVNKQMTDTGTDPAKPLKLITNDRKNSRHLLTSLKKTKTSNHTSCKTTFLTTQHTQWTKQSIVYIHETIFLSEQSTAD